MPDSESCKRTLEFSVAEGEVEAETGRVVAELKKKIRLPGFRPGKAPDSLIRSRYESDIRKEVLESLVPKYFRRRAEQDNLKVVGNPGVTEVHFQKGEPLRFTVEFEVAPEIELGDYRGLTVPYREPEVSDEDVAARLEEVREQKAEYLNIDPRPVAGGDYAVISLESLAGLEGDPISSDEMVLHIGDQETLPEFNEHLTGVTPGEEKEFEVSYPAGYGNRRLAGHTVRFRAVLKGLRRKELPELSDEFARDLGDFQNLDELREEVRIGLLREREMAAQAEAKQKLVDTLVEAHDFPVPEAYVEHQVELNLEQRARELVMQGIDPRALNIDWDQVRSSQRERAMSDVKASLILEKIADREAIETLADEVDREVHRAAKQLREPAAAVRMRMEKDGTLRRIAHRIRTDKVLSFLFEQARKVAPEAEAE